MSYVLDTNIFNRLVDGKLLISDLPQDKTFFATHVQIDELSKTADPDRRQALLKSFASVIHHTIPTHSFDWDVSDWHGSEYGDDVIFMELKASLDALNKAKKNNTQDCLIAELSIVNGFTLLSTDEDLCKVTNQCGGKSIYYPNITKLVHS